MEKIFLSHIAEELPLARTLKTDLERAVPGVEIFVSGVDIRLGQAWLDALDHTLTGARAVLVLCSPRSTGKPWVNFESGGGWSRKIPVIPICHGGLRREHLPYPLSIFQALDLDGANACEALARELGREAQLPVADGFDFTAMASAVAPRARHRQRTVGIALTHRQSEWSQQAPSVFALPAALPSDYRDHWQFRPLTNEDDLLSQDLHELSGVILGNPWRSHMSPEAVDALFDWVSAGGRLLMLGFELGDRHHGGNLGDLARRFGIHPAADIVGPPDYGPAKPYAVSVQFSVADAEPHALTAGLSNICLSNVQTISVEPGGTEWLRVGRNVVYQPERSSVMYRDGALTQPRGQTFHLRDKAAWLAVAAEAPAGLCGDGAVQAIGTWELLGWTDDERHGDAWTLLSRLLDWLSGQ